MPSIASIALMSTASDKEIYRDWILLAKNRTRKLSPISEAGDVADNKVDCKVLFLQCLTSYHFVYLILKILSAVAKLPCYCFHLVLFLKRFSCQLNTFSDTDTPLPLGFVLIVPHHDGYY